MDIEEEIRKKMDELVSQSSILVASPETIEKLKAKGHPIRSSTITYKDYLDIWESHFDDNDEGEYSHRWVKKLSKEQFEIQRYQFERIQNRIEEIQSRKDYGPKLSLKII